MMQNYFLLCLAVVASLQNSAVFADPMDEVLFASGTIESIKVELKKAKENYAKDPSHYNKISITHLEDKITSVKKAIKNNLNETFSEKAFGKDERSCILNLAKNALSLHGDAKESLHPDINWGIIELEQNVYFERHTNNDFYTIYGRAEKLNPPQFKVQMRASWNTPDKAIPFCALAHVATSNYSLYSTENPVKVTGALDTLILTRDYKKSPKVLEFPAFGNRGESDVLILSDKFKKERTYSSAALESRKKQIDIHIDNEHLIAGAGEATLWVLANRYSKMNVYKGLRLLRRAGKIFFVGEQTTHLFEAYEFVYEGGEPKWIQVKDENLLQKIKNTPEKMYEYAVGTLKETGVLYAPESYLDLLEAQEPGIVKPVPAPAKPVVPTEPETKPAEVKPAEKKPLELKPAPMTPTPPPPEPLSEDVKRRIKEKLGK